MNKACDIDATVAAHYFMPRKPKLRQSWFHLSCARARRPAACEPAV